MARRLLAACFDSCYSSTSQFLSSDFLYDYLELMILLILMVCEFWIVSQILIQQLGQNFLSAVISMIYETCVIASVISKTRFVPIKPSTLVQAAGSLALTLPETGRLYLQLR